MQAENKLLVYNEDVKFEKYGPTCVNARSYMNDIKNELRSEKLILSDFLTVREFSKKLKHI